MRYFICSVMLMATLFGCDSERYPQEIPIIKTETITDISQEGAVFTGSVLSLGHNQKIIEYGFVWSTVEGAKDLSSKIEMTDLISKGKFSVKAKLYLNVGKKYFVRAYLKTEKVIVFANEITFSVSLETPVVSAVIPNDGFDGDIITVKGQNFAINKDDIKVTMAGVNAQILASSSTEIKIQVPATNKVGKVSLQVEINKKSVELAESFLIRGPSIFSITPSASPVGFVVEIMGDNLFFPSDFISTNVTFGESTERHSEAFAVVGEATKNKLKVYVPNYYPLLPSSPPSIETVVTVTISSFVNNISGSKSVKTNFKFLNSWQKLGVIPPLDQQSEFHLQSIGFNGKGYIIGPSPTRGYGVAELWEYDPMKDTWKQKADFLGSARAFSTLTAFGDKLFYGMGSKDLGGSIYETDIWAYDINLNSWNLVTNFPGVQRLGGISFSASNKLYVGFGSVSDLWTYDLATRVWSIQDISSLGLIDPSKIISLQSQGRYYLMTATRIFELNTTSNTWTSKPDLLPEPFNDNYRYRISNSESGSFIWYGSTVLRFRPNTYPYWERLQDFAGSGIPFAIYDNFFIGQWKLQVP